MGVDLATILHIPGGLWEAFLKAMRSEQSIGEEVLGFWFCSSHEVRPGETRMFPRDYFVPGRRHYSYQTRAGLSIQQNLHVSLLNRYVRQGFDIVHVHTHPSRQTPVFSAIDDREERGYAKFLAGYRPNAKFISVVGNEDLSRVTLRRWDSANLKCYQDVELGLDSFMYHQQSGRNLASGAVFSRQSTWGSDVQDRLYGLRVALVGCGGIGSIFAEQLSRLGVRDWLLVDPDVIEETNLNRMPFATRRQAVSQTYKVSWLERLIRRMWQKDAKVAKRRGRIEKPTVQKEVGLCDFVIVATDNEHSRLVSQRIASMYARPLLCLGSYVNVESGGYGRPKKMRAFSRVTFPPLGGNRWCLVCGGVIDPSQAALEEAPDEIRGDPDAHGYLNDVPAPAVYWLNGVCASLGVGIVHQLVSRHSPIEEGADWIIDLASHAWHRVNHTNRTTCLFCSREGDGYYGRGNVAMS